jgi:hypothetical protein
MKNSNLEHKTLGMKIKFGPYEVRLATNGQISYFKNGELSRVKDMAISFNEQDLYVHTLELATKMGYAENSLIKA